MVGPTEISALLSSLRSAKELAEAMVSLRGTAAMQTKIVEFNSKIMDAQQRAFAMSEERTALLEKVRELEADLARMRTWETEKKRYVLKRTGYSDSALVYELRVDAAAGESPHSICVNCYEAGSKSVLQGDRVLGDVFLFCPKCKTRLLTSGLGNSRLK